MANSWFRFRKFTIHHGDCAHKVGTDGVILGAWAGASGPQNILDVGSGSGLISLMMAQRFPHAKVTGIEVDTASYRQSLQNIQASSFSNRINIIHHDFLSYTFDQQFDLIVSNPPFFRNAKLSGKEERDRARHAFSLPHEQMIKKGIHILNEGGNIALILPFEESNALKVYSSSHGLHPIQEILISNKPSSPPIRSLIQYGKKPGAIFTDRFSVRNETGEFSDKYRTLTKDFYPGIE